MQGSVKFYNAAKGFGFIVPADGSQDMFFHITQTAEGFEPRDGSLITYDIGAGKDGRPAAANVTPAGSKYEQEEEEQQEEQQEEEKELNKAVEEHKAAVINGTNEKLIEELNKNPELISSISPRVFEILVAKILDDMGYDVSFTQEDEAGARYIVALSMLPNKDVVRTVVACKKNDESKQVTAQIVEQFLWVTEKKDYANKAMIVTTTSFSVEALKYEKEYSRKLSLKDKEDIKEWLKAYHTDNDNANFYNPQFGTGAKGSTPGKREYLDELLYSDDLEKCTEEFYKLAEQYSQDTELTDAVLLLAGSLTRIENAFRIQKEISFEIYSIMRTRLSNGIANLRHEIYELPFD